jgi:hypothetical protein
LPWCSSLNFNLPSSYDYRCEPPHLAFNQEILIPLMNFLKRMLLRNIRIIFYLIMSYLFICLSFLPAWMLTHLIIDIQILFGVL